MPGFWSLGFWIQPLFYSAHGWIATEMALWLLFHPYEPKFVPGTRLQIPFTPGIFPRGRHKLSVSIANTITEMLLTGEDIKKQAEKLVTEENLYRALDSLIDSVGRELRDVTHLRRLYKTIDEALPPLIHKLVRDGIGLLETRLDNQQPGVRDPLKGHLQQFLLHILPQVHMSEDQAEFLTGMAFEVALTPDNIRKALITLLSDDQIAMLDKGLRKRTNLFQNLLLRVLDLKQVLGAFREFLIDRPSEANEQILIAMDQLELQEKVTATLMRWSPTQMGSETLDVLGTHLYEMVCQLLIQRKQELSKWAAVVSSQATHSITGSMLNMDFNSMGETWLPNLKRDTARFMDTYLHKELENMLSKALPAISLNTVIVEKIDHFSAKQLEETIQRICSRELRWLALLGAFLGFWLGLVSNFLNYLKF